MEYTTGLIELLELIFSHCLLVSCCAGVMPDCLFFCVYGFFELHSWEYRVVHLAVPGSETETF